MGRAPSSFLETGKVARQADGAVVATYGETALLATWSGTEPGGHRISFLTVNYQEKSTPRANSRRLFQAGRRPDRDADLAADRPSHPPAFS